MVAEPESGSITRDMALAALDCGVLPLFMLGPRAHLAYANRAAGALLDAGRAFRDAGGRLAVQRQSDQDAIEGAVHAALDRGQRSVVHLANRQEDLSHVITVSPLPGATLALVAVADLQAGVLLPRRWSAEALPLNTAQAELAEALAGGENLAEFAQRTGLTIGGARTRLKKLSKRLGARSQSDLVALLLRAASVFTVP